MAFKIIWSAESKLTYLGIIDYLSKEWTEREIRNFVERVHNKLDILSVHPEIGKVHKKRYKIHQTLIHKKVTLVYHIKPLKKEVHLLSFWDNRQDPAKLKY